MPAALPIDAVAEAEYNNRTRIPEYRAIVERWAVASALERPRARAALDQPYGRGERQRYDLFYAGSPTAPLLVYIHGGYWQLGSGRDTAFLARRFTEAGLDVAIPSYSLCPAVSVAEIIDELRRCVAALWTRTGKRPVVAGHSAGGHLTAALLATPWQTVPGVPDDLVRGGCAISGVFDLTPMIGTTMNAALRLDAARAREVSPLFWLPPPAGRELVTAVGADETGEFHRQSRTLVEAWARAGVITEAMVVPGTHHFSVVDELTRPDSALFARVVSLARRW
jgi:arylformamidase